MSKSTSSDSTGKWKEPKELSGKVEGGQRDEENLVNGCGLPMAVMKEGRLMIPMTIRKALMMNMVKKQEKSG